MGGPKHWTEDEERLLLQLKEQGKTIAAIARELERTQEAVNTRLTVLKRRRHRGEDPS